MWKVVKKSVLRLSRSFGYDIVPLREVQERDLAVHLGRLFTRLGIDCVFDVGANIGQYRDFLRNRVFYTGQIISFEPVTRNVKILRERSRSDARWLVEGCALGREDATMPINVAKSDQFSSFLEPDNERTPHFSGLNETAHQESVLVKTLDEVFHSYQVQLGFHRPYLKVDTEGFDLEVFRGGENILPFICALQTEAWIIGIYKGVPSYTESIQFLNARGFDITALTPVSRDPMLRLITIDCVMLNRERAGSGGIPEPTGERAAPSPP